MINFILYEDSKETRNRYKKIIRKLMPNKDTYKIFEIGEYNDEARELLESIKGRKIYLLDVEVPGKTGIDLARSIRNSGDYDSQLILITSHEEYNSFNYVNRLLALDFISKASDVEKELHTTLELALNITSPKKTLSLDLPNNSYQIPYDDILYIEKEENNNNCNVVTEDKKYSIRDTISHLYSILEDDYRFFKTHRGCIVNLNKITSVDFLNNIIYFNQDNINLLAKDKKSDLKEKLKNI